MKNVIDEVSTIVSQMTGIQLGPKQAVMVESRLKTRMLRLQIDNFATYLEYLKKNMEQESQALVSLLTTHHSYFFREFSHFEFLLNKCLPTLCQMAKARSDKTVRIWSAACSRGQEAYSLAMFFDFHLKHVDPTLKFQIYGTDVDIESVKAAKNAVYKSDELKTVPAMYLQNHWIRGKGSVEGFYKMRGDLASRCQFDVANLLSPQTFLQGKMFDLIFCRNVFIYFEPAQIATITTTMLQHLDPKGYLAVGVSETLHNMKLPVTLFGPSIYVREEVKAPVYTPAVARQKRVFEVLVIEDSNTIHTLMQRILVPEQEFKVTGVAKDGQQALDLLKTQKFDAITLDLHMPVMDGVAFLENYKNRDVPILVVSSVSREEASLGQKAISLGAFDYVEKPSFENLAQAGNEIRSKLLTGIVLKSEGELSRSNASQFKPGIAGSGSSMSDSGSVLPLSMGTQKKK
jgi:chemotaxis protein methyltransferase CheR